MTTSSRLSLRERRDAVVQEHIAAGKAQDITRTIATFHHPRYELAPFYSVSDGDEAVHDLLAGLFAGFPDFDIEHPRLHHAEETVVLECVITGTRHRPFAGVRPTGRRIEMPLVANFDFDGDLLMCEKVNFDLATLMRQLQG
jgi:predicted ester cyclase